MDGDRPNRNAIDLPEWQNRVFKYRGALLALPALALAGFGRPSAVSIALGLPIALAGEAVRCWAVGYSGVTTRSDAVIARSLVTAGPYAHVRNPLYVGNFLTALGFSLAFTGKLSRGGRAALTALGLGTMAAVYAVIIPLEESYLRKTFGTAFEDYVDRVPRIVPQLQPAEPQQGTYDPSVIARAEVSTFLTFGAMLAALALKLKIKK
jgi:protein-S-isoprenylcysteine O-methyltransferase Ste14